MILSPSPSSRFFSFSFLCFLLATTEATEVPEAGENTCAETCTTNGLLTAVGACNNQKSGKAIQACAVAHGEGVTVGCRQFCDSDSRDLGALSAGSSANAFCAQYIEALPKPLVYKGCIQGFNKGFDGAKRSFVAEKRKQNALNRKNVVNQKKSRVPKMPPPKRVPSAPSSLNEAPVLPSKSEAVVEEKTVEEVVPVSTSSSSTMTTMTVTAQEETQMKQDVDQIVEDAKAIPETVQNDVEQIVDDAKSIGPMVVDDLEKIAADVRDMPEVATKAVKEDIDQFMEDVHNIAPMMKGDANELAKEMKELPDQVLEDVDTLKKDAQAVPDKVHEDIQEVEKIVQQDVEAMEDLVEKQVNEVKVQLKDMEKAVEQLVEADKEELAETRIVKKKETLEKDVEVLEENVSEFVEDLKNEVKLIVDEDKKIVEGMVEGVRNEIQNDVHPSPSAASIVDKEPDHSDVASQMQKQNEEVSRTS